MLTLNKWTGALAGFAACASIAAPLTAQSFFTPPHSDHPTSSYSSSVATVTDYGPALREGGGAVAAVRTRAKATDAPVSVRPFSAIAFRLKTGSEGIGLELVTPLSRRVNLRGGASLFSTAFNPTISNVDVLGKVHIAASSVSLDFHPFAGKFRISPGVSLFNDVNAYATGTIAPGSTVTFGTTDYTSSPTDPLNGWTRINLGKKIGPRLTIGSGNMIPHERGKHFSVPFEIGAHYVGAPSVTMGVTGSACNEQMECGPVSMGDTIQNDLQTEIAKVRATLSRFSIVPIVSMGISYKF